MAGTLHQGKLAPHMELAKASLNDKPVYLLASNNDGSVLVYCPATTSTWTLSYSEIIQMALEAGLVGPLPAEKPDPDPEVQGPEPEEDSE